MRIARLLFYGLAVVPAITAHDHHGGESKIPEGKTVSAEPLVSCVTVQRIFRAQLRDPTTNRAP
jgi:hypothetical protein